MVSPQPFLFLSTNLLSRSLHCGAFNTNLTKKHVALVGYPLPSFRAIGNKQKVLIAVGCMLHLSFQFLFSLLLIMVLNFDKEAI